MGIIEIDKNLVPYEFDIELSERIYTIAVNYNFIFNYFTIDLKLNNKVLAQGEKMVLNEILFRELYEDKEHNLNEEFPSEFLIPMASSSETDRITFENFGTEVQLYYAERNEIA